MTEVKDEAAETDLEVVPIQIEMRESRSLGTLVTVDEVAAATPEAQAGGRRNWLFIGTFVLPVLLASLYLFFIAADRYQSEVRFIVRSTSGGGLAMDAGGAMGAGSLSRAGEDAYIVDDYIVSRDALARLVNEKGLNEIVARPEADVFNRFPSLFRSSSRERLFDYYKSMVRTWVDGSTGISTIEVTAFRPEDAQLLARALLAYAETVVNRINDRANSDRVTFARQILDQAKATVADAERRLTAFRTESGTVDPTREYAAALQSIGRLSTEASQREATLNQQVALTPNGPGIAAMREKVRSYRDEIARQNQQIAGGQGSLAEKLAGFEQLTLERDIAAKELVNAEVNLETSQREAGQQRLYLQPVVEPSLPDRPEAPKRFLLFGLAIVVCGFLYYAIGQLKALAEEHAL